MKRYQRFCSCWLLATALLPAAGQAQGIYTGAGTQVVITGAPQLVLNDAAVVNEGTWTPGNSTVLFTGRQSGAGFIGGSRPVGFYSLTVDRPGSGLLLQNNVWVAGILRMNNGMLELNNHRLDLGSTGSIAGERNEAHITGQQGGTVTVTALLNGPQAVNPGNIGVEITSAAWMGTTTITRGHVPQADVSGSTGIGRYYDIQPSASNANLHAVLRFYYLNDELAGNDAARLMLFAHGGTTSEWVFSGRDNASTEGGWVGKNVVAQAGRFTLAVAGGTAASLFKARAFPNPARDAFTLELMAPAEKDYTVGLYDWQGRLLETKTVHCLPGLNQLTWNIGRYAASVYYLRPGAQSKDALRIEKQ